MTAETAAGGQTPAARTVPARTFPARTFPVWAPIAETVSVEIAGRGRLPLVRDGGGWWRLAAALDAGPEPLDYGFVVDDAGPFPDPRSRRQPDGVHALSREWSPAGFEWTDDHWRSGSLTSGRYRLSDRPPSAAPTRDTGVGQVGRR